MCSITAMPAELILGHSPPVYSPLLYSSLIVTNPPMSNRSVPPRIRPCLSSGSLNLDGLLKNSNDVINKRKKRVVFADDRGRPLTEVSSYNLHFSFFLCLHFLSFTFRIKEILEFVQKMLY